jgi:hypothetical protein
MRKRRAWFCRLFLERKNMLDILNLLPVNLDALTLSLATAIAGLIILGIKAIFTLARKLAQKTPTKLDDKLVDETEAALKDKGRDL